MDTDTLKTLDARFGIPDRVRFDAWLGGLPIAVLGSRQGICIVALQGAQVLAFQPGNAHPVLWLSESSVYAPGKPIRGGIPICWPWFGPHPTDPTKPQHGFARNRMWTVRESRISPEGATELRLGLTDSPETRNLWPHAFDLELVVSLTTTLTLTLTARNPGRAPFTCSGALHSYFEVADINSVAVHGLQDTDYFDKITATAGHQAGPVRITGETDRVYQNTTAECVITDPGNRRMLRVGKRGSHSTVVWNPWEAGAARLADFDDRGYLRMICVETANAGLEDVIAVPPQESHVLGTIITVESLAELS
jgi:D-hexose-6-phosphate mutarotase